MELYVGSGYMMCCWEKETDTTEGHYERGTGLAWLEWGRRSPRGLEGWQRSDSIEHNAVTRVRGPGCPAQARTVVSQL